MLKYITKISCRFMKKLVLPLSKDNRSNAAAGLLGMINDVTVKANQKPKRKNYESKVK